MYYDVGFNNYSLITGSNSEWSMYVIILSLEIVHSPGVYCYTRGIQKETAVLRNSNALSSVL